MGMNWILLIGSFLALMCIVTGGFGIVVLTQSQKQTAAQQPAEDLAVYPMHTLPPTWTATVTLTPRPSATLIPGWGTTTPVPSFKLTGPSLGLSAPDFTLKDTSGNPVSMSNYNGKAVLLLFLATWCPHCANEVSSVESVYEQYNDKGFRVLAIDVAENASKARSYRNAHGLTFMILNDSNQTVSKQYHVTGFPTHFFVAPDGQISSIVVGELNHAGLDSRVKSLLSFAQ
jgi:peroxiredoxin